MNSKTIQKMLKILPLRIVVDLEDLMEIYSQNGTRRMAETSNGNGRQYMS
jgi:hypothetical protein